MKRQETGLFLPAMLVFIIGLAVSLHSWAGAWQSWPQVGKTTLTWGIWDIYDAQLRTPSGNYDSSDPYAGDMALIIEYQRNVSKERLLEATDEQWQHLQVAADNRARWIGELGQIWQDVGKGDRLVFLLTGPGGEFYYGNQLLGRVDDPALARSFLAIWLSDDTSYPKLRRQLIGQ